jgi:hypothetical protein
MKDEIQYKLIDNHTWYITSKLPDNMIEYLWERVEVARNNHSDDTSMFGTSITLEDPKNILIDNMFYNMFMSGMNNLFVREIEKYFMKVFSLDKISNMNSNPRLGKLWVNIQKKGEFVPMHDHGGLFSFVIWMKIPYDWADEKSVEWVKRSKYNFPGLLTEDVVSNFVLFDHTFTSHIFKMSKDVECNCVLFPSSFHHMVYPFYTSDEERISISGNVFFELGQ